MIQATLIKWAIGVLAFGGLLAFVFFRGVSVENARWEARWTAQEAQYAKVAADARAKANEALTVTLQRNAEILGAYQKLQADRDSVASDLVWARRLLAAARSAPGGGSVQQTPGQPGPVAASGTDGDGTLTGDVAAAIGECIRNADRLDAVVAQVKPQT